MYCSFADDIDEVGDEDGDDGDNRSKAFLR